MLQFIDATWRSEDAGTAGRSSGAIPRDIIGFHNVRDGEPLYNINCIRYYNTSSATRDGITDF